MRTFFKKKLFLATLKKGRFILLYGLAFSILFSFLTIHKPSLLGFIENKVYDSLVKPIDSDKVNGFPIIVNIDEKSLKEFGQWPWPRYRFALLLEKLQQMGARSIGLDMIFAEADRTSIHIIQKDILRDLKTNVDFSGIPSKLLDNDKFLAETLSGGPFVLGYKFLFENQKSHTNCLIHPLHVNMLKKEDEKDTDYFFNAPAALCNLELFSNATGASGFMNAVPDSDGILRSVPLIIKHNGNYYPSLALATSMKAMGTNQVLFKQLPDGTESIKLNNTIIPLSSKGRLLIRFRGKGKTFKHISASDILSDKISDERINGKIVFIGFSSSGMEDVSATPTDSLFPGVEIHATVVDNILKADFLSKPSWILGLELSLVLLLGILSTFLLVFANAGWSLLFIGISTTGIWLISVLSLQRLGLFISPVFPLLTIGINFILLTFLKFWSEEHRVQKRSRELAQTQEATIESMLSLTETRDKGTGGHIKRTQLYVMLLANNLMKTSKFKNLIDEEAIDLFYRSAPLHDIGKVGVADSILLKFEKLDIAEFEEMKKHTTYGRDVLMGIEKKLGENSFLRYACDIAYTHHEKWDGSGYPQGLRGEEIPISGRLMAIADVYDALVSKRNYKSPIPHKEAVGLMLAEKGTHFDPNMIDTFMAIEDQFRQIAYDNADYEEERKGLSPG